MPGRAVIAGALAAGLLPAVLSAALGYAEGGHLSRELGGWRVICRVQPATAPHETAASTSANS